MSALALAFSGLILALSAGQTTEPTGPLKLCFRYSSFSLAEGERIADLQMGIHGLVLAIESPRGRYQVHENEILVAPRLGRRVLRTETASVYRSRNSFVSYVVMSRPEFSPDRDVPLLVVSGEALQGTSADARIYARITVGDPTSVPCDRRYLYGWDVMLEPDD